jgi:hypothetical protein
MVLFFIQGNKKFINEVFENVQRTTNWKLLKRKRRYDSFLVEDLRSSKKISKQLRKKQSTSRSKR